MVDYRLETRQVQFVVAAAAIAAIGMWNFWWVGVYALGLNATLFFLCTIAAFSENARALPRHIILPFVAIAASFSF